MARIALPASKGGFISTAGKKVLLKITKCEYDPEFGKVEMQLENEKGEFIKNDYSLMTNDGSVNEPALKAFAYFSRVAMGDWNVEDVEPEDLVGKHLRADIVMTEGKKTNKDGKTMSFANIDKCYMISDEDVDKIADASPAEEASDDEDDDWE